MTDSERHLVVGNAADEYAKQAAQAGALAAMWQAAYETEEARVREVCRAFAAVLPLWPAAKALFGELQRVSAGALRRRTRRRGGRP